MSEPDFAPLAGGPAYHLLRRARLFPTDAPTLAELVVGGHLTNAIHRLLALEVPIKDIATRLIGILA